MPDAADRRAEIIDGKAFAAALRGRIAGHVSAMKAKGVAAGLAVVLLGGAVYRRRR